MKDIQQAAETPASTHWGALNTTWDKRTKLAADWIQTGERVADIGCGLMALEAYLPKATTYVPLDIVPRDSRTIVVDLTKDSIPIMDCSVAVVLGVLEYVDDVKSILVQLQQFPKSLISYNHISIHDVLWKIGLRQKRVDWRNRHFKSDFRRLLRASGLRVLRERQIRIGEGLYEVVSVS